MNKSMNRSMKKSKIIEGIKKPPPQSALLGSSLIVNFVKGFEAREEDKPILEAIKDSVWRTLRSNQPAEQKAYWAAAAILASYNFGREGLKLAKPNNSQNPEDKAI